MTTIAILFVAASNGSACKYSVRDVAFVDLGVDPFGLRIHLPMEVDAAANNIIVAEALAGSNVRHELVVDPTTRNVRATLTAPDGREFAIPVASSDPNSIRDAISSIAESPLARRLLSLSLDHHSVVLVVQGSDEKVNETANQIARDAAKAITGELDRLPKPIKRGPVVVSLSPEEVTSERLLLFTLSIDQDRLASTADVAIIYGRLRRLGPVLRVPPTQTADLTMNLNYAGQDCECELDRDWMTGPMIPHVWSEDDAQRAVETLDFDPGSPLVQIEIHQILARGPSDSRRFDRIGLPRSIDPLLGYTETEIEPVEPKGSSLVEASEPTSSAARGSTPTAAPIQKPALSKSVTSDDDATLTFKPALWIMLGVAVVVVLLVSIRILLRGRS